MTSCQIYCHIGDTAYACRVGVFGSTNGKVLCPDQIIENEAVCWLRRVYPAQLV